MVALTSRSLIHNLNEIRRLEKNHFHRLGQGETKTVKACGSELESLALHYKTYVGSQRVGIDGGTSKTLEAYFSQVAEAMEHLEACLRHHPAGIHLIYDTYEHGHAAWSLDGGRRSADMNNVIMQLWHEGHAAQWFLPTGPDPSEGEAADPSAWPAQGSRAEELIQMSALMRRLAKVYAGLQAHRGFLNGSDQPGYDEKDALVFNLAELIKKKARPVLHTVEISTSIHEWATGDLNPPQARFLAAYQTWKNRPLPEAMKRR